MTQSIRYLRLFLHLPTRQRRAIGYLSQYGDVLRVSFDADYIEDPNRPTLSLAYRGATEQATRDILGSLRDARVVRSDGHWPVWFQNLLPEGHNRERLARERGCSEEDELELLAAAGHDLFGAVEVEPMPVSDGIPETVRVWHAAMGIDVLEPDVVQTPVEDAASIPGVVTKFSAIKDGRRYVVKRQGKPGAYILKLPSTRHPDLVDNELTGYRLAASLGLCCAEAVKVSRADVDLPEHVDFDAEAGHVLSHVLAVKRFDRGEDGLRVHMEELAQALQYPPRKKYGRGIAQDYPTILRLLDRLSSDPANDVREVVQRFVAFVLMGNTDAHLKNWALLYPDGITPKLSPLYDPVCVSAWFDGLGPSEYAVNRAIDRSLREFEWGHLEALLRTAEVPRTARLLSIARDTVKQAQSLWPAILVDAPDNVRASVEARLDGGLAFTRL